jgi:hypothetical protein
MTFDVGMLPPVRIRKHDKPAATKSASPMVGQASISDGRPSVYFYWDVVAGRRLAPNLLTGAEAIEQAGPWQRPSSPAIATQNEICGLTVLNGTTSTGGYLTRRWLAGELVERPRPTPRAPPAAGAGLSANERPAGLPPIASAKPFSLPAKSSRNIAGPKWRHQMRGCHMLVLMNLIWRRLAYTMLIGMRSKLVRQ